VEVVGKTIQPAHVSLWHLKVRFWAMVEEEPEVEVALV
jgi:hypothetical protein